MDNLGISKSFDDAWARYCNKLDMDHLKALPTTHVRTHIAKQIIATYV